jgi:hypothetical protein
LRQSIGEMKRDEAATALEGLTIAGAATKPRRRALQLLGRFYAEEKRYRDAFQIMRTALIVYPNSEMTRRIQDEAAVSFESLFLGGKSDAMAPIDALSLFYDFRDLDAGRAARRRDDPQARRPARYRSIARSGRRAAAAPGRQPSAGLGASQVAVRPRGDYLMGRKPDRALQVMRTSRSGDLPNELRSQRLLIEARAQSDVGPAGAGAGSVANLQGLEAERLRADISGKARRWRDAAEQIEKTYGERWKRHGADRWRARRRAARGVGYCARRGYDRARSLAQQVCAQDGRRSGPARLRRRDHSRPT